MAPVYVVESGIADGIAFLIPRRLGEDASQFDFPSMGRLAFRLALPTDRLFLHHRDSRPIHLHVRKGIGSPVTTGNSNCRAF